MLIVLLGFCMGCFVQARCIDTNKNFMGILIGVMLGLLAVFGLAFELKGAAGILMGAAAVYFFAPGVIGSIITWMFYGIYTFFRNKRR